jgi:hypothetical protein
MDIRVLSGPGTGCRSWLIGSIDLVPKDNFYRRLQERLDLSFVRELLEDPYAASGRA